nr:DUF305 domain-containing protein [Janibacter sp. HTCC2649]
MKRLFSALALALVATLTLAGCGTDDASTSAGGSGLTSSHNEADLTFAQSMIPHHEQAVLMAKMATANASTTQLKELASTIEAAQGPEIETMGGWLKEWGEDVPSGNGGMDHDMGSMGDMPGMMSDDDMSKLDDSHGVAFDRMFLTMMVKHHTGAIEMARTEQSDGQNAEAVALAKKIEADQTAEIATMQGLLSALPSS